MEFSSDTRPYNHYKEDLPEPCLTPNSTSEHTKCCCPLTSMVSCYTGIQNSRASTLEWLPGWQDLLGMQLILKNTPKHTKKLCTVIPKLQYLQVFSWEN